MSYTETNLSRKISELERALGEGCDVIKEINNLKKLKTREEALEFVKKNFDCIEVSKQNKNEVANIRHGLSYLELTNN